MSVDLSEDHQATDDMGVAEAPLFKYLFQAIKHVEFSSYEHMTNYPWLYLSLVNNARKLCSKPQVGHVVYEQDVHLHEVTGICCGLAIPCYQRYSVML